MDLMGLKSDILKEILEDLDDREGSKLKPKAAISVTAVKPEMEMSHDEPDGDEPPAGLMADMKGADDDEDDEKLKQLLQEYLSQQK